MDYYQVWFDLKPGVKDTDFARNLATYMGHLKERGLIEGWKLSRRKLGLAPQTVRRLPSGDRDQKSGPAG